MDLRWVGKGSAGEIGRVELLAESGCRVRLGAQTGVSVLLGGAEDLAWGGTSGLGLVDYQLAVYYDVVDA